MKHGINRTPKKKVERSLQVKLAWMSVLTLCGIFVASSILIFIILKGINGGIWNEVYVGIGILLVCGVTVLFGGYSIWHGAMYVTNPLQRIIAGVEKVTQGDFSVEIHPKLRPREVQRHIGPTKGMGRTRMKRTDEIDLLAKHFNQMVRALAENDYITNDFINNVSHELQTPVSAIAGFVEMMEEDGLSETQQKAYLTYISEATQRLSGLADSMLLLSRLDHQAIIRKQVMVRQDEVIRHVVVSLQEKWAHKNHDLNIALEPIQYVSNKELLYGIYHNIIDNSMKYTPEAKGIDIHLKGTGEGYVFIVEDQGIGIESQKLNRIYDRFYQCDESHQSMGSGLGMSIVHRAVSMMGGTIDVTSEYGKGTRVEITFINRQ